MIHNSQSSDSVPDPDLPSTAPPPDQDPVMPPPSPLSTQHIQVQVPPSDHDDPPPTSPHPHPDPPSENRPDLTPTTESRPTPPTSAPSHTHNVQPKEETASLPQAPLPAPRRQQRQRGRPGRPPNINENSLMRRLECVMAVESGRMTMITACQQYDISARTFYRWLRNKDRLIELTGFTEDDFKNGNPSLTKQTIEAQDAARMPPHRSEQDPNLPRLPNQPVVTPPDNRPSNPQPLPTTSAPPFAGAKRRLPKAVEPNRDFQSQGQDRFPSPNTPYYRRNFTKMPPQPQYPRDPAAGPSERQAAARNATRMRRDSWHDQPNVDFIRPDERPFPVQYTESPSEPFKRRKVTRPQNVPQPDEANDPIMISTSGEQQPPPSEERPMDETQFVNGNSTHHPEGGERNSLPREGVPAEAVIHGKAVIVNGARPQREVVMADPVYDPRAPRKHRIEVMMGRRKVTLAWYDGTAADDIKTAIARRFALLPEAQWALVDHEYDEVIISDGLPSGRYTLTVLS